MNLRNDVQHFQDGLFIWDIPTFNEKVVREVILNAVSHRDYKTAGSIWIKQYSREIIVASPGGFPSGINAKNMLWKQQPQNRRIAEVFAKCGLVERAGQGADRIFEESIKQGKLLPDFSHTDEHEVVLTLNGEIQDENFLRFLERVGQEQLSSLTTEDFLVLHLVHRNRPIPSVPTDLKIRLHHLVHLGIIEQVGSERKAQYMLCKKYYVGAGRIYTKNRGVDRENNKKLLLEYILANAQNGSKLSQLCPVLPLLSERQVQELLKELKTQGLIYIKGMTKSSLWFPITTPMDKTPCNSV
ncbi:MAG: hypothetical protein HYZ54_08450 [Ignavibacteriae bacterium]|nr:hypothetical protein [Ignavibacteriota bacterium]